MINYRREDQRYSDLYRRGYGPGPIGALLNWSLTVGVDWDRADVLDCGCGQAALRRKLTTVRRYVGVDVAGYPLVVNRRRNPDHDTHFAQACSDRLPLADRCFSIAWCCDVLEHVPESGVADTLGELARVARWLVLSISTRPSRILDAEGNNLHLTVRPADWWLAAVERFATVTAHAVGRDFLYVAAESFP